VLSVRRGILDRDGGPMGIEHKINREEHEEKFVLKNLVKKLWGWSPRFELETSWVHLEMRPSRYEFNVPGIVMGQCGVNILISC
jgi:hypothetical protein